MAGAYSVYLVRCANGELYTGIASDVERRFREHAGGKRGARFLRGRGPLELVYQQTIGSRGSALRLEHRVKRLPRERKEALVAGRATLAELLPDEDLKADQASGVAGG